jgi:Protein of unknown function (DUF1488)
MRNIVSEPLDRLLCRAHPCLAKREFALHYNGWVLEGDQNGGFAMPLQRGEVLGYDFNRMVVDFTMLNQGKTVRCAISTAAMDDLEGKHDVKADQRVDQFVRLRDAIEERTSRKFFEGPADAKGAVVLRSNDFFK